MSIEIHFHTRLLPRGASMQLGTFEDVGPANDGVMAQTIETANLARAENFPIIIAINKSDVYGSNPDRVRYQLLQEV